jgi:hypothetical protein
MASEPVSVAALYSDSDIVDCGNIRRFAMLLRVVGWGSLVLRRRRVGVGIATATKKFKKRNACEAS